MNASVEQLRMYIEPLHPKLSIRRQCELLGLARSSYYFEPAQETAQNLELMRRIDALYLKYPFLGSRRIARILGEGPEEAVNRKRVQRLMRLMGIEASYPRPKTSVANPEHQVYPYLLRGVTIERVDQVWSTDITYIPMRRGFIYLVAVIDWYSRFILSWEVSNSLDMGFCIVALERTLRRGTPEIFNTDQGSQFTSKSFTGPLKRAGVDISMDGKGRAIDNIWIERFWRSLKYEEVYLKDYESVPQAIAEMASYIDFYNWQRPHQSLGYEVPAKIYCPKDPRWQLQKPLKKSLELV